MPGESGAPTFHLLTHGGSRDGPSRVWGVLSGLLTRLGPGRRSEASGGIGERRVPTPPSKAFGDGAEGRLLIDTPHQLNYNTSSI